MTAEAISMNQQLLASLFRTSIVGVAVFDGRLRYRAVNRALASMNGIPAEAHFGKTVQQVLGKDAAGAERAIDRVFSKGRSFSNYQFSATLPTRMEVGHWVDNFFPLKNDRGRVIEVGAIVYEITKRRRLEDTLSRVTGTLRHVSDTLRNGQSARPQVGKADQPGRGLCGAAELLDGCLSEIQTMAHLLAPGLLLTAEHHHEPIFRPCLAGGANPGLSQREVQVLQFLADGKANKQTAAILGVSTRTVETYRAKIMLKLGVRSCAELVRYAIRNRLVATGGSTEA
jgi:DNA-binding CsgD family transcriptional regulator